MNSTQVDSMAIIETVKPFPFLYDKKFKCSIREKADKWAELGATLGISGHQMQTRFKSLKDKYILLRRREEAYPGTNLGRQIHSFKYTDVLSFLDETIPPYSGLPPKNRCYKYVAMNKSWEKSHTLLVIKQLENYPLLYDKSHPYYNHCLQRMAAYRKISDAVKRYNPEVTPEMISKKIRTIRTQFAKEKRDQKRKKQKPGAPFIPKLWFYNRLKFLDEKRKYDSSNLNGISETDQMVESLDDFDEKFVRENFNDDEYEDDYKAADVDEDDEEYNDADEWLSSKDSTRPFEQVELLYGDEANIERECFEGEIEEVFDQKETTVDNRNQTRNELYAKCTGLLESLAKQMKPYEADKNTDKKECNCKNCSPSSLLGKMIETELAKVSEHIYMDAKWKIIRILEEAQKKSFREKQDHMM